MTNFKIVADSSADLKIFGAVPFSSAPLKIITDQKEFADDQNLNLNEMVEFLSHYKGKSSTSCPNPENWLETFSDAKQIFCITISASLSGSYNAAVSAKQIYEERYPDRKVFVINSLSTGGEMKLIMEYIALKIGEGKSYEEICEGVTEYQKTTGLLFMLESMKNLANNGRVSPIVAKAAGLLGIRIVGKASDHGTLEILDKSRGEHKAVSAMFKRMVELGFKGGKVRISHCFNSVAANTLKDMILKKFENSNIEIYSCGGLCSFYAEKGGMLVGFEK